MFFSEEYSFLQSAFFWIYYSRTLVINLVSSLFHLLQVAEAVLEESDSHVPFRMMVVNCTQVRASLREKSLQLAQMLMAQVLKTTSDRNHFLCERFAEIQTELQKDLKVRRE